MLGSTCRWSLSSLCVLDAKGKVIREAKVASEPEALIKFLRGLDLYRAGVDDPGRYAL